MHPAPGRPRTRSCVQNVNSGSSLDIDFTHQFTRFDLAANLVQNGLLSCQFLSIDASVFMKCSYPLSMLCPTEGAEQLAWIDMRPQGLPKSLAWGRHIDGDILESESQPFLKRVVIFVLLAVLNGAIDLDVCLAG